MRTAFILVRTVIYRNQWREAFAGFNVRYGSGTAAQYGRLRLPGHATTDFSGGLDLWQREQNQVKFEFNLLNLSDSRYRIAKESEETPIQFASPRIISGHLKFSF